MDKDFFKNPSFSFFAKQKERESYIEKRFPFFFATRKNKKSGMTVLFTNSIAQVIK